MQVEVSDRSVPVLPPESVRDNSSRSGTDGPKPVAVFHYITLNPRSFNSRSIDPCISNSPLWPSGGLLFMGRTQNLHNKRSFVFFHDCWVFDVFNVCKHCLQGQIPQEPQPPNCSFWNFRTLCPFEIKISI